MWTTGELIFDVDCVLADTSIGCTCNLDVFMLLIHVVLIFKSSATIENLEECNWIVCAITSTIGASGALSWYYLMSIGLYSPIKICSGRSTCIISV